MKDIISGILRHVLTIVGGAAGAAGVATDDEITLIAGGLAALIGVILSVVKNRKKAS